MPEEKELKTVEIKLEDCFCESKDIQVDRKIVGELKALAKIQENSEVAENFANMLGNNGKDFPNAEKELEEKQIDLIADGFEIEEE
jgi:hypothetical protein